ncbi:hypothetical protein BHM03_00026492, partial [Ensete ventricosum]
MPFKRSRAWREGGGAQQRLVIAAAAAAARRSCQSNRVFGSVQHIRIPREEQQVDGEDGNGVAELLLPPPPPPPLL